MLEYILLGFLMEKSQNGYQMKQDMALGTSNFVRASFGSIYPALKRLQSKGFITSEEKVHNGKYTKVYTIIQAGTQHFMEWLRIPADVSGGSHEHLAKMYFYDYLDEPTKHAHFRQYIEQANEIKQKLYDTKPLAKKTAGPDRFTTLLYGIRYYSDIAAYYSQRLDEENGKF